MKKHMMFRIWTTTVGIALAASCYDDPHGVAAPPFPEEQLDTDVAVVARDGDDEGCWYLVWYYLDTGEVFNTQQLWCTSGGSGSQDGNVEVRLGCDGIVTRGDIADCHLTTNPSDASISGINWQFTAEAGTVSGGFTRQVNNRPNTWSGRAAVSGRITVTGTANPDDDDNTNGARTASGGNTTVPFSFHFDIDVRDRTGNPWNSDDSWFSSSGPAGPPTLDTCVGRPGALDAAGVAYDINANCDGYFKDGSVYGSGGTGPWQGLYFTSSHNLSVNVKYQVAREYRTDATRYSLNGTIATQCPNSRGQYTPMQANALSCATANNFRGAVQHINSHERQHVNRAETAWDSRDLFDKLEDKVGRGSGGLNTAVRGAINSADAYINLQANFHVGGWTRYTFWKRHLGTWTLMSTDYYN